jgi:alkylated DNA nucleotide flippase Atl1
MTPSQGTVEDRVIAVVRAIPEGYVMTYGDIARRLGLKTPRQVGAVLARGSGSTPWHRVIHADGSLVKGLISEQSRLLRSEGVDVIGGRVKVKQYRW